MDKSLVCGLYSELNKVYLVTSELNAAFYDINKYLWSQIHEYDNQSTSNQQLQPLVWLNNKDTNILYCARKKDFRYLDMRDNNKKWQKMDDIEVLLENPRYLFV